jgi:hypothetical protein
MDVDVDKNEEIDGNTFHSVQIVDLFGSTAFDPRTDQATTLADSAAAGEHDEVKAVPMLEQVILAPVEGKHILCFWFKR